MEIYTDEFLKIINVNCNYPIIETDFGRGVKISARDAFIYSAVTGAGYLENRIYPFTLKGILKLFYNAFNYKIVSGLIDQKSFKNSPYLLSRKRNFLTNGDKILIPIEFKTESELLVKMKNIYEKAERPEDILIQRIETSKKGNGMEPFLEFLTSDFFRREGFIVENQVPLGHSMGSPDFAGYVIPEFIEKIHEYGFLGKSGFHVFELAMIRSFKSPIFSEKTIINTEFIVGEAKTGTTQMEKQIEKYLTTNLFNFGYEIHPSKECTKRSDLGLISFSKNYKIKIIQPTKYISNNNEFSKESYQNWLINYFKFYLIANLTDQELQEFHLHITNKKMLSESDMINFITNINLDEILKRIKKIIKN